jgi:hypothetical protein
MLNTDNSEGNKDQDQQKFGNSDGSFHECTCTDMDEFNNLLSKVSTKVLWTVLMTQQERQLATAWWEACNYGGKPKPGNFSEMEPKRNYMELVLRIQHCKQWKSHKNKLS